MLIGFLGAPCSGKTTTAAMAFAELKDMGIPAEFVVEKARKFIAGKRVNCLKTNTPFTLTDEDQNTIAMSQFSDEQLIVESVEWHTAVITDSSVFNSLIYMSEAHANEPGVRRSMQFALDKYDLLFLCGIVPPSPALDSNRVHNQQQSFDLDTRLQALLKEFTTKTPIISLSGSSKYRAREVVSNVLNLAVTT